MERVAGSVRVAAESAGWVSGFAALLTPLWFASAAFGTKWGVLDWALGLAVMTYQWGPRILMFCLLAGVLTLILMGVHYVMAKSLTGTLVSPLLAVLIGAVGLVWSSQIEDLRASGAEIYDISTDGIDPPHFTPGFAARRTGTITDLNYQGKTGPDGRPVYEIQREIWPDLVTLHLEEEPDTVYRRAVFLARETGWHIGTASQSAGMFEAGTESVWFGFRDDMVVRIRSDEAGGSLVDMRSVARQNINDNGRNAQRIIDFFELLRAG